MNKNYTLKNTNRLEVSQDYNSYNSLFYFFRKMRKKLPITCILFLSCLIICRSALDDASVPEDNEFAEFEQFDADDELVNQFHDRADSRFIMNDEGEEDGLVEVSYFELLLTYSEIKKIQFLFQDEDSEFEHFQDPEEFEGFAEDIHSSNQDQPKITITKVQYYNLRRPI